MNALEYIFKNDLENKFKDKADKIRYNTGGIGWGFNESMNELYYDYYSDYEDGEE